jgi:hypothetical protein
MDQVSTEQQLVIRPKRSKKKRIVVAIFYLIIFLLSVYATYYLGYKSGTIGNETRIIALAELEEKYSELKQKNAELTFELAKLEQYKEVQKAAYSELEKTYETVEGKNEFLNRRVNFYRSILSPEDGVSGLRVHAVKLTERSNSKVDFEITLVQSINHERKIKVNILVELFDSKKAADSLDDWKSSSDTLVFSYSKVVRGSLRLDSSLRNKFVKITVTPENDSSKQLVEWHKI